MKVLQISQLVSDVAAVGAAAGQFLPGDAARLAGRG
jgi:hypothetical protein